MHDLDRTQMETEFGGLPHEASEYEHELEGGELEMELEHVLTESEMENEQFLGDVVGGLFGGEMESPLNESEELELASELLGVGSEMEFEQFLGNLFKSAAKGIGNFAKSSAGRALGGVLKTVAKKAIPVAGRVLGGMVGGPIGSTLGGKLGDAASNLFELEFEGMNHEDREFEVAKKFVRFGATAAKNVAHHAHAGAPPKQAVRAAVTTAARAHAPGLLRRAGQCTDGRCAHRHVPHAAHPIHPAGHPRHAGHPMHRHPGMHPMHAGHRPHPGHPHAHHHQHGQHPHHYGQHHGMHAANGFGGGASPAGYDDNYPGGDYGPGRTGRWVRRGRHIVLLGFPS